MSTRALIRRGASRLAWLCSLTYLASYLTRLNFAAVTVEIISSMGWDKPSISVVTTGLFVTYGIGQLISGRLCDKYSPFKITVIGLLASIAMNMAIPLCTTIPAMTVVWCINGFAQSMMWPPMVKILSGCCNSAEYQRATMVVTWACPGGTLLVYLLASGCTALAGWRTVFYVCSAVAAAVLVLWVTLFPRMYGRAMQDASADAGASGAPSDAHTAAMPRALYFIMIPILIAVIMLGVLRDSISTWLPSYVLETFNMGNSSAILTGVVIPVFTTISYPLALEFYHRFFTSELSCSAALYGVSTLAAAVLLLVYDSVPVLSVLLLALICAAMHAANLMIVGLVPKRFAPFGNVGTVSGLINCFVYVGSSLSIWGVAHIAERWGWLATITAWGVVAALGVIACLAVTRSWSRAFKDLK